MNHSAAISANLAKANERLDAIQGSHPTEFVQAHMSVATVFMLGALVEAVRELTATIRETSK